MSEDDKFNCAMENIETEKSADGSFYIKSLDMLSLNEVFIGEQHAPMVTRNLELEYKIKGNSGWNKHHNQKN
jgi:hypothetical protein